MPGGGGHTKMHYLLGDGNFTTLLLKESVASVKENVIIKIMRVPVTPGALAGRDGYVGCLQLKFSPNVVMNLDFGHVIILGKSHVT